MNRNGTILLVEMPTICFAKVVIPVAYISPDGLIVTPAPTTTFPIAVMTPTTLTPDSLDVTADPTVVCSNVALVAPRSPVFELNVRFVPV